MRKSWLLVLFAAPVSMAGCGGSVSGTVPEVSTRSIGPDSDPRGQIRNECWYALDPGHIGTTNDSVGPDGGSRGGTPYSGKYVISKTGWNYLSQSSDSGAGALKYVLTQYGGFVSDIIPGYGGTLSASQVSQYASAMSGDQYGLYGRSTLNSGMNLGGTLSNYAHGTQCLEFAMMVIYRARHGKQANFNYGADKAGLPSATGASVGDVVFHEEYDSKSKSYTGHVAICVANDSSAKTVTLVDSNFASHEVIAKHSLTYSEINGGSGYQWRYWSARNYL